MQQFSGKLLVRTTDVLLYVNLHSHSYHGSVRISFTVSDFLECQICNTCIHIHDTNHVHCIFIRTCQARMICMCVRTWSDTICYTEYEMTILYNKSIIAPNQKYNYIPWYTNYSIMVPLFLYLLYFGMTRSGNLWHRVFSGAEIWEVGLWLTVKVRVSISIRVWVVGRWKIWNTVTLGQVLCTLYTLLLD